VWPPETKGEMMSGGIYLIQDGGKLVKMMEARFPSEDVFQELLASYPDLLPGEQVDPENPRKWLLIAREMGIPAAENESDRWSVDHLFLDQDGIPTLVEVKRSTDSRIRREVVGQMLDYAANVVVHWPMETIRAKFEEQCDQEGSSPSQKLQDCFGMETDEDVYWSNVKKNLQAGCIRMIFVADEIPSELRRIVEFLNEQLDPAEVLAVEIKHFAGEKIQTLVPRVFGLTAEAQGKKTQSVQREPWDADSFMMQLQNTQPRNAQVAGKIMEWARKHNLRFRGGRGAKQATLHILVSTTRPMCLDQWGGISARLSLYTEDIRNGAQDPNLVDRVYGVLNRIDGIQFTPTDKYPGIPLMKLESQENWEIFTEAMSVLLNGLAASNST